MTPDFADDRPFPAADAPDIDEMPLIAIAAFAVIALFNAWRER